MKLCDKWPYFEREVKPREVTDSVTRPIHAGAGMFLINTDSHLDSLTYKPDLPG